MPRADTVLTPDELKALTKQGRTILGERKNRDDPEHREQRELIRWARLQKREYPELQWLHAVPNGGARDPRVAGKLKAEGVVPGVWDLNLDVPRGQYHGFKGEMKAPGGRLSREQKEWRKHYEQQGYYCAVATSWTAMADEILWYLGYK